MEFLCWTFLIFNLELHLECVGTFKCPSFQHVSGGSPASICTGASVRSAIRTMLVISWRLRLRKLSMVFYGLWTTRQRWWVNKVFKLASPINYNLVQHHQTTANTWTLLWVNILFLWLSSVSTRRNWCTHQQSTNKILMRKKELYIIMLFLVSLWAFALDVQCWLMHTFPTEIRPYSGAVILVTIRSHWSKLVQHFIVVWSQLAFIYFVICVVQCCGHICYLLLVLFLFCG